MTASEMQLGKNGITTNFIETLKSCFEKHDSVRISVLRSAISNREDLAKYASELTQSLGKNYTARIIGFKIIIKKWRKQQK